MPCGDYPPPCSRCAELAAEVERLKPYEQRADELAEMLADTGAGEIHEEHCVVVRNVNGHALACSCQLSKVRTLIARHAKMKSPDKEDKTANELIAEWPQWKRELGDRVLRPSIPPRGDRP